VMDKGRLMEKGTHAELKAKAGLYCSLLEMQ
jgi:ABC transporter, permease/ATP-binding protein